MHAFPRLTPVACFPALGISCMFSRGWHRFYVFPRLQRLHIVPRLAPVVCFPALDRHRVYSFFQSSDWLFNLLLVSTIFQVISPKFFKGLSQSFSFLKICSSVRFDCTEQEEKCFDYKLAPALAILTAHSSIGTPSRSPAEQMFKHIPTGFPVAFITSIAHSASST